MMIYYDILSIMINIISPPFFSVLGSCQPIEVPRNGRVIPVRGSRESAYRFLSKTVIKILILNSDPHCHPFVDLVDRFGCNLGFHLVGESSSHCVGQAWSHTALPICASELWWLFIVIMILILHCCHHHHRRHHNPYIALWQTSSDLIIWSNLLKSGYIW